MKNSPKPSSSSLLSGVDLGVTALQVDRSEDARSAVPRTGHEDHVLVVFLDQPVQVDVAKRQTRARPPVSEEPVLDVLRLERFAQERVLLQVDHSQSQVRTGAPIGVGLAQFFWS